MSGFVLTSDSLIGSPASGNIEYSGQFYGTDTNNSRAQFQRLVLATALPTTSGTSFDFTGIPAWTKRITVMSSGSTYGSSALSIKIGSAVSGIESTGYKSTSCRQGLTTNDFSNSTTEFVINGVNTSGGGISVSTITLMGSNLWMLTSMYTEGATQSQHTSNGSKTLSGTLDRLRFGTTGNTTWSAGTINILYEG